MLRFSKQFALFTLIFLALNLVSKKLIPNNSTLPLLAYKLKDIETHKELNTFFFGSSILYRQIEPALFDSISCGNSASYNVGIPAVFNPQLYDIFEDLLDQNKIPSGSKVFLELQNIQKIGSNNLYTPRSLYKLDLSTVIYVSRAALKSDEPFVGKLKTIKDYAISYLYKSFSLHNLHERPKKYIKQHPLRKLIKAQHSKKKNDNKVPDYIYKQKGFEDLDSALKNEKMLKLRKNKFLKKYKNKKFVSTEFERSYFIVSDDRAIPALIDKIDDLTLKAATQDIELIILLPSYAASLNSGLKGSFKSLNNKKISLFDYENNKEFYLVKNRFDSNHLNKSGAKLFTHKLAKAYNELLACD